MGRLTVQFDNDFSKALEKIAEKKHLPKTEVLRRAVETYNAIVNDPEIKEDIKEIRLVQGDKVVKRLRIP